jgi:Family of unknown function (DUF5677)
MPSGALDTQLHRHIIDVLLGEYEANPPPQEAAELAGGVSMRLVGLSWGLYAQVNRHAKAAVLLSDGGMAREAHVHLRVALEHAIYLHWVVEQGDAGVDAMMAAQAVSVRKSVKTAHEAAVVLPPDVDRELNAASAPIDESKAVRQFRKVCEDLGLLELYFIYGVESGFVHPSLVTINAYAEGPSKLTTEPQPGLDRGTPLLLAQCLIWARRDLDRLLPGRSDAVGLDALAQSIDSRLLPPYRPAPAAAPAGRRSRRSRK